MQKERRYPRVNFSAKVLAEADAAVAGLSWEKRQFGSLRVVLPEDEEWSFDTFEEFLAAADQGLLRYSMSSADRRLEVHNYQFGADVSVRGRTRDEIEKVFAIFDRYAPDCRLPDLESNADKATIFIGHGHDQQWRDLKDHLHEKHGYSVEAYEIGAREGHAVRDILEEMLNESSFALLVMTGEDETKDGKVRARQNVVHEAGLFQGKLGFTRAIILFEEGAEEFSNIAGLQQIRFSRGRIRETFGDVLAVLKREFG